MNLDQSYKIINSALDELREKLKIVEPKFNEQVIDWIKKFETYNGYVLRSQRNDDRLLAFKRAVERFLLRSGYSDMVQNFLVNFDELQENQKTVQKGLNNLSLTQSFLNPYKRYAVKSVISGMEGNGLDQKVLAPIESTMFYTVTQGGSLTDLIKSVEGIINTTQQRAGLLTSNAIQVSRDALGQYNGTVNDAIAIEYEMDGILYVGSLVKDSREQCKRWVDYETFGQPGLIPVKNLPGEIRWAYANGTGMIPGTTPETFRQFRGGYNCRHEAYPVRLSTFK
jgi:hypothetical protein